MPNAPRRHRAYRTPQRPRRNVEQQRRYDEARGSSSERGYNAAWQKARKAWLLDNPLCVHCKAKGEYVTATEVDHIVPHDGPNSDLFHDRDNWQGLCKPCHSAKGWRDGSKGKKT